MYLKFTCNVVVWRTEQYVSQIWGPWKPGEVKKGFFLQHMLYFSFSPVKLCLTSSLPNEITNFLFNFFFFVVLLCFLFWDRVMLYNLVWRLTLSAGMCVHGGTHFKSHHWGGRGRLIFSSSRPAWSTKQIPGHPGLQSETSISKQDKQE